MVGVIVGVTVFVGLGVGVGYIYDKILEYGENSCGTLHNNCALKYQVPVAAGTDRLIGE